MLETDSRWYADPQLHGPDYFRLFYGGAPPSREDTAQEVGFVIDAAGLAAGSRVLDLCCGWGRHSLELARRGFDVVGLDLSEHFLSLARAEAAAEGLRVEFLRGDMRHIPCQQEFDAVIMMGSPFGVLETDEEDTRVFRAVAAALRPGGRFFLATANREGVIRNYRERDWMENEDGTIVLYQRRLDLLESRNYVRMILIGPDGHGREYGHRFRFYTLTEFFGMLASAGLTLAAHWGDFQGGEFTISRRRLLLLANRVGQGASPEPGEAGASPYAEEML